MKLFAKALALAGVGAITCGIVTLPVGGIALAQETAGGETPEETAARYGIRASVLDISLSPSGNKIAFIGPGPAHAEVLNVIDLEGDARITPIVTQGEINLDLAQCDWATEMRLVCQVYGMSEDTSGLLIPFDRMFAVNADGTDLKQITERRSTRAIGDSQNGGDIVALDVEGEQGRILLTRSYMREETIGTRLANDKEGLGVDLVDVENGRRRTSEKPDNGAVGYLADSSGRVRLKIRSISDGRGTLTGTRVFMYRSQDSDAWKTLGDVQIDGKPVEEFWPAAIDSDRNALYGFVTLDGYDALVEVPLDDGASVTAAGRVLLSRNDADVDSLIRIGRQRRVVGASYATEKRQVAYFDEELKRLASDLAGALPDTPLVNIEGASADENRIIIIASSDTQPGMVYLFDKAKRSLEPLLAMREYLTDQPMGKMTPITYPARDGTQIPAYLTLPPGSEGKNLPSIVLPHGGPAARDVWGFDWLVQFFTARGYAVLQPNYRGSSGYGEDWYGRNGFKAWDVAISDVNDAGRWLASEGIADPEKLAIAGWSYGGYAALQSQVVDPDLFKAVVAIAPVTDLEYLVEDSRRYTNYRLVERYVGEGPHIQAGSPLRHPAKFDAPVALFHGTMDLNVDVRHSRAMEQALRSAGKQVTYREFEDLQHGLGDSKARSDMLAEIDRFLTGALDM